MMQPDTVAEHLEISKEKNIIEQERLAALIVETKARLEESRIAANVNLTFGAQSDSLKLEEDLHRWQAALAKCEEIGAQLETRLAELEGSGD